MWPRKRLTRKTCKESLRAGKQDDSIPIPLSTVLIFVKFFKASFDTIFGQDKKSTLKEYEKKVTSGRQTKYLSDFHGLSNIYQGMF